MDSNFTRLIGDWLRAEPDERDYTVGALYLLRLSGNKIEYANLVRKPDLVYLEHRLQKYYNYRVQNLTHEEVEALSRQADAVAKTYSLDKEEAKESPAETASHSQPPRGKRDDHDSLPDDIQALYVENLDILRRMREVHLRLRTMSLTDAPCPDSDRYPFVKELVALDKLYRDNWHRYDTFQSGEWRVESGEG